MKKAIRRLRLRKGDILVVSDVLLAERLSKMYDIVPFKTPIIIAPDGIKRISKEYLNKRLVKKQITMEELKTAIYRSSHSDFWLEGSGLSGNALLREINKILEKTEGR
jgi:hypothetical protein